MSTPQGPAVRRCYPRFLAIDAIVRAGEGHQGVPLGMAEIAIGAVHAPSEVQSRRSASNT